jgi:PPOX class probable F420-dependent enzyme
MRVTIPQSHVDLLERPVHGVLTTMNPDGQPQMSVVWVGYDGECLLISTTLERRKGRNMQANPLVNVIVVDPENGARFLEVRGEVVAITEEGAIALADRLAQAYSSGRQQRFYGDVYAPERQFRETRVVVKIAPVKVTTDAIFG